MNSRTVRARAAEMYMPVVLTRADLASSGLTGRAITNAVRSGDLCRLRRDRYAVPPVADDVAEAVRIGGTLSCVSLLADIGVFVLARGGLHVHIAPGTSRIRVPRSNRTTLHWASWSGAVTAAHVAPLADALRQAIRCQVPRAAIATVDSVLHHGLMSWDEVAEVFATLPARHARLLALVDGSAESGPETFVRLILRSLGVAYETQVWIAGVGRVDFLIEGWLIIECDSREFHQGWEKQVDDRRRDIAAAAQGYITIRPLAADILSADSGVRRAIERVIEALRPRLR